jgi:type I restriction enzyme S subunit
MGAWTTEPLENCLDALIDYRGKSPTRSQTGIPVLSAKVVKTTGLLRPIEQTITPEYYQKWMTRGFPRSGDIVMTTEAPMGEVIQLDIETAGFALGQRIVCLRGKRGKLHDTFLRYLLTSPDQQNILASYATGTTVLGISQKALRSVPISYPAYGEQQQIGELLCALDDKIELNRQMNETLEASARALFRDWFVDFGPTRAKAEGRPAYLAPDVWALFPERLDNDDVPDGWTYSPIAKFCDLIANGGTPKRDNDAFWHPPQIPWLTSGEVRKPFIVDTVQWISQRGFEDSSAKWVSPHSTVVALYGATAGEIAFVGSRITTNQAV